LSDGTPLRLSWSRLRLHSECPAKGSLVAAHRKSPVTDYRNFFPGTVADRCMRGWLRQEHPARGWMAAQVDTVMAAEEEASQGSGDGVVRWRHLADKAEVRELCVEAVRQLEGDLWSLLRMGEPPAGQWGWDPAPRFEVPVTIPHPAGRRERIFLTGEIDLLALTLGGAIQVWDLKTTRDDQYWRKTMGQLVFYEIAVWCMKGQWPERSGLLQPLCAETMPSWEFTMDHRTQMLHRIVSTAGDIWAGRLDPKPSPSMCPRCEVRHACPIKGGGRGRVAMAMPVSAP
jgi:hypothetical protein